MLAVDSLGKSVHITVIQRMLMCVTVTACLFIPFASQTVQVACACLVVAGWAAFVSTNDANIVHILTKKRLSVLHHAPSLLVVSSLGFLAGWIIATVMTKLDVAQEVVSGVMLGSAFVLVVVFMLFFPKGQLDETEEERPAARVTVASDASERELFERRCQAVADVYRLSPRETDILAFLAKGRNAAYIQNKLTISPHTVKSHIYNIYRKVDIHSQQNLMDFVETYPLETDGATSETR